LSCPSSVITVRLPEPTAFQTRDDDATQDQQISKIYWETHESDSRLDTIVAKDLSWTPHMLTLGQNKLTIDPDSTSGVGGIALS